MTYGHVKKGCGAASADYAAPPVNSQPNLSVAAQDAELVALEAGKHHPARTFRRSEVLNLHSAQCPNPLNFLGLRPVGWPQVRVYAVLDLLASGASMNNNGMAPSVPKIMHS